ncbi:TSN3 protein, partial [Urocolius indicus]|nr:TSN3 protein [Urocolius indicus]
RLVARSLLVFLGIIFWSAAAAMAFAGICVIQLYKNFSYVLQEYFLSLPGWLTIVAALILLPTGVLAIYISVKRSCYQQGVLMYLLLILLCLEMSSVVLVQFYSIQMASEMKSTMSHLVYQHNGKHSQDPGSRAMNTIQRKLQCCGVQNYTDWINAKDASWHLPVGKARVPESCCKMKYPYCKEKYPYCRHDLAHLEQLFQEGCLKNLEDQLDFVMSYLFWCCTVLIILELLAGVTNGILMKYQPF